MQYFREIYSTRVFDAVCDGINQQVCNENGTSYCSPYYNSLLLPSSTTHVLLNTEVIKQTIFRHEAVFKNQVIELHRLYARQTELMNEMRNDFDRENTQETLALSEYGLLEQIQSTFLWLSPSCDSQSVSRIKPIQLEVEKNVQTDRFRRQVECTSRQYELLDAKCKKYNNKVLDLQLLASEYMDDEDDRYSGIAEATHPVINTSPVSATNDECVDQQPLGLDVQESGLHAESSSARPILFDLNEPFIFEETTATLSNDELLFTDISSNTSQQVGCPYSGDADKNVHESVATIKDLNNYDNEVKLSYHHETGQKISAPNPLNEESNRNSSKPKRCDEHSGVDDRLKRSSKKRTLNSRKAHGCIPFSENNTHDALISINNKTKTHSNHVFSPKSMFDFRRNPIAVQALPCTNAAELMKKKKCKPFLTSTGPAVDNNQLSELWHHKPDTKKGLLNPPADRVKKSRKGKQGRMNVRARNLNQDSYRLVPLSPENEECSPPRGESDVNLYKTLRHFCTAQDGDTQPDVARIAAKAIVFLSAADVHVQRCSPFESSIVSPDNPLHWFAEVASSVDSDIECFPPSGESQESLFGDLEYFETMTLKLKDTSIKEQYCRGITGHDEKLPLVTTFPHRGTRARGRRSRKLKDFQGIVLPGISSLSKDEVTEDLQLIDGLMEATVSPKIFSSKKRNRCSRGRRQSINTSSIITDNSPCFLLDLQNKSSEGEYHSGERRPMIIDWGKKTRRRRGQRYPARKLTFIHVAPTLKAH